MLLPILDQKSLVNPGRQCGNARILRADSAVRKLLFLTL